MRALLYLGLVFALCFRLSAEEISPDDSTIIPGVRVGPIEKGTTLFGLKTIFGGGKVKAAKIDGAEGEVLDGARLFEGTDKELEILFNPDGDEREIWDIRIIGKGWKFDNGLKLGMTVGEVEKINGKPYTVLGFGWDYGGYANFEGGKLDGKVSVRFDVKPQAVADSISGDRPIPSTDKTLRGAKAKVETISIIFR